MTSMQYYASESPTADVLVVKLQAQWRRWLARRARVVWVTPTCYY
jgi:hypothetical protein